MITVTNLSVKLPSINNKENIILKNLNLSIKSGDFVTVVGTNGAGKSTLLNVLGGSYPVYQGTINLEGKDVTSENSIHRSKWVARVFQNPELGTCGQLTIEENMALAYKRGLNRGLQNAMNNSTKRLFRQTLAKLNLGLEDKMDTPMNQLSGGQRQAVSLLMACLVPLKLLLLDEHTSALDPKTSQLIMEFTKKIITENNLTALMVTHNFNHALNYGNRTIILDKGEIIKDFDQSQKNTLNPTSLFKITYSSSIF